MPKTKTAPADNGAETKPADNGNPSSLTLALAGRKTKRLSSAFPAVWTPEKVGEYVIGQFLEVAEVRPEGNKPFNSMTLGLDSWCASFTRSGQPYQPVRGELVGCSGEVLMRALKDIKEGVILAISYMGLGKKKGKRSPAKIFDIQEVLDH